MTVPQSGTTVPAPVSRTRSKEEDEEGGGSGSESDDGADLGYEPVETRGEEEHKVRGRTSTGNGGWREERKTSEGSSPLEASFLRCSL